MVFSFLGFFLLKKYDTMSEITVVLSRRNCYAREKIIAFD